MLDKILGHSTLGEDNSLSQKLLVLSLGVEPCEISPFSVSMSILSVLSLFSVMSIHVYTVTI